MYICICNAITENDIKENPELKYLVGIVCGKCLEHETNETNEPLDTSIKWLHI